MSTHGYTGRQIARPSMKRLKKEGYMADDAHNNWSTFALELQDALSRLGIDADIWINDMGFMEVVCTETEESCVLFTSVLDRPYFSMRLNIQLPSGSFSRVMEFETDDYPDNADEIAEKISWIGEKNERRKIRRRVSR